MKAFFRALLRPLTFMLSGTGFIVCGGIQATNSFDENDPRETIAGIIILIGGLFWTIALITLALRLVRWLVRRKTRRLPQPSPRSVRWYRVLESAAVSALLISLAAVAAIEVGPLIDSQMLDNADPAMVSLANEAGMSREGTLIFLRTHPRLVSDSEMQTDCAENTAANNSNGFIEQGCYVPATNQIFLRKMPDDLHSMVTATAAYEMLHPVYIALHDSSRAASLDAAIEANFTAINDPDLNNQVGNFAKTEPGARDLELFSLLGTGYSNLTDDLAQFYAPYFDNLSADVAANDQVKQLFQSDEDQLSQMDSQIKDYDTLASDAYATSARWAQAGSQYWDDYYYNQYRQYLDQENNLIDQYNNLLDSYNALVTEYNGTQPVQRINPAQTQSL
jgi:hypothetical protein